MGRFETLLINLLTSIDQKLGAMEGLLKERQDAEHRGNNGADADDSRPE